MGDSMSRARFGYRRLSRLCRSVLDCSRDRSANVSITYALALVPTLALLGLGTDWFQQQSYKKRLDAAADAAALSAITTAKAYIAANSATQSNAVALGIAAGTAQAAKTFAVNAGSSELHLNVTPQISFPLPQNQTYTATVSYATTMPTNFGRLVGTSTFNIAGSATSTLTMGQYIDFYVLLDVSGSMGIPTTTAGQTSLASINPDDRSQYPTGCVFACHYTGSNQNAQGYKVAEQNSIALRVDTVGQAVNALIQTATSQEQQAAIANEFRIGLYPFIVHAIDAAPLSSNFTRASTVASNLGATYLDQGWGDPGTPSSPTAGNGTKIGSGGTHFENIANDMPNYIQSFGNGQTASGPKPFLFVVTDGVDNNQTYPFNGSQPQLPSTGFCDLAKTNGFTVAVLYIPYVPISNPNPSFASDEDDRVNALVPPRSQEVPNTLKACATSGFFFTASSPTDINNALQTMFFQALQVARLSQ